MNIKDFINQIIYGDNLEIMPLIPDKSVNLIIADPPYNINKADWDKIPNYIEWLGNRLLEMQRVLKDNGSFYLFHNHIPTISKLMVWIEENTNFIFKQFIVWDKYTKFRTMQAGGGPLCGILQENQLRNYYQFTEYILFYTLQDDMGLTKIFGNDNCFKPIRDYLREEKNKTDLKTCKQINQLLGVDTNGGGMASHYFSNKVGFKQWALPTKEMYQKLQKTGYFKREYEDLRLEYENLRYTFNNQKTDHTSTVWHYPYAKQYGHITPKPIELIKNILRHSSNEGDIVLIPFVGSGNDCIACKELKRNYIGIENKLEYVEMAKCRIRAIPELLFN